jgi:hypothetical protein
LRCFGKERIEKKRNLGPLALHFPDNDNEEKQDLFVRSDLVAHFSIRD